MKRVCVEMEYDEAGTVAVRHYGPAGSLEYVFPESMTLLQLMASLEPLNLGDQTRFRLGRAYRHTTGKRLTVVGVLPTTAYGTTMIAEDDAGDFRPVGGSTDSAANWTEESCYVP